MLSNWRLIFSAGHNLLASQFANISVHAHILVEREYSQLPQDKQKDHFVALENEYNLLECLVP